MKIYIINPPSNHGVKMLKEGRFGSDCTCDLWFAGRDAPDWL